VGLSAIPMGYAPRAAAVAELSFVRQEKADGPELVRCWLQKAPARQLPNLAKMPMLIVNGEGLVPCAVRALHGEISRTGGRASDLDRSGQRGVHGNGHMMMWKKNNLEVAAVIEKWTAKSCCRGNLQRGKDIRTYPAPARFRPPGLAGDPRVGGVALRADGNAIS